MIRLHNEKSPVLCGATSAHPEQQTLADHVTALEDFLHASRPGDARALVAVGG